MDDCAPHEISPRRSALRRELLALLVATVCLSDGGVTAQENIGQPQIERPEVPLPPKRPAEFALPAPPAPSGPAAAKPTDDDCLKQLQADGFEFEPVPSPVGGGCAIDKPVRLSGLAARNASRPMSFPDKPVIACSFAKAFGSWARDLAAPVAKGYTTCGIASHLLVPEHL